MYIDDPTQKETEVGNKGPLMEVENMKGPDEKGEPDTDTPEDDGIGAPNTGCTGVQELGGRIFVETFTPWE